MTVVALSAAYGAGGSQIAPALAERLGVPFLDRAISFGIAERLDVPLDDVAAFDENAGRTWVQRLLRGFIGSDAGVPVPVPPDTASPEDFVRATEEVVRAQATTGEGVILGRAAVVVLRNDPNVLRVRLTGPPEARLRQAMQLGVNDRETAERTMRRTDRTHADYVKEFYGLRLDDPALYHLMLDSTAIDVEASLEILARATAAFDAGGVPT